jgi:hypothetical protein
MKRIALAIGLTASLLAAMDPTWSFAKVHSYELSDNDKPVINTSWATVQDQSEWCWAACIQMCYQLQGANVDQKDVVLKIDGILNNQPAQPQQIAQALTTLSLDRNGQVIASNPAVYLRDSTGHLVFSGVRSRRSSLIHPSQTPGTACWSQGFPSTTRR